MSTEPSSLSARLRATFGPAAAGLLGGALLGLAALPAVAPLSHNVARTYSHFPSLDAPSVGWGEIPTPLMILAVLVGLAGPIATGALAVWLARPRDLIEDVSVGITTALAATLSAFVSGLGWAVILACVIVPSIPDLTLATESPRTDEELTARYPDLREAEPKERGGLFMGKIVSDQVTGSSRAVTWGIAGSFLSMGVLAFGGTLAAATLRRRNEGFRRAVVSYLEMVVPTTVSLAYVAGLVFPIATPGGYVGGSDGGVIHALGLALISGVMVFASLHRYPWLPRLCLALTWFVWLTQMRSGSLAWVLAVKALALTGLLLYLHLRARRAAVTTTP